MTPASYFGGGGGGGITAETQTAISGISASDTVYTSGTVAFTGSNMVTVKSGAGQQVILDATQTVQTQGMVNAISNSQASFSGTVNLSGAGNVAVGSQTGNAFTISGSQSVQPGVQNLVASDATFSSGTVSVTGIGGGATVNTAASKIQVSVAAPVAQSVQPGVQHIVASDNTFSSGTVSVTGVGGGATVNTAASKIQVSVAAPVAQSVQPGVQHLVASDNTFSSGTVSVTGIGAVTVNTAASKIQISANSQTLQTSNVHNVTLSGNTAGAMAQISSGTMTLAGGPNVTVSQAGNAVSISAGAGGGGVQHLVASDATFSSGTVSVTGVGGGATVNTAASKIQVSVAAPVAQSVQPGVQHLVASDNTFSSGTVSVTGVGGGATVNTAASKIQVSVAAPVAQTVQTQQNVQSIAASNTTYHTGQVQFTGVGGGVTVSSNTGQRVDISVAAPGGGAPVPGAYWANLPPLNATAAIAHLSGFSKTPCYFPVTIGQNLTLNRVAFRLSAINTSTLQSFSIHIGVYSIVNPTSGSLMGSASDAFVASTASSVSWSGNRDYALTSPSTVAGISNIAPGVYVFGCMFSAGASGSMNFSLRGADTLSKPLGQVVPGTNSFSTGTSQGFFPLFGKGTATVNAMPANIAASDISNYRTASDGPIVPYVQIRS